MGLGAAWSGFKLKKREGKLAFWARHGQGWALLAQMLVPGGWEGAADRAEGVGQGSLGYSPASRAQAGLAGGGRGCSQPSSPKFPDFLGSGSSLGRAGGAPEIPRGSRDTHRVSSGAGRFPKGFLGTPFQGWQVGGGEAGKVHPLSTHGLVASRGFLTEPPNLLSWRDPQGSDPTPGPAQTPQKSHP